MLTSDKRIYWSAFALALIVFSVALAYQLRQSPPLNTLQSLHFHPDDVREVQWAVNGETRVFRRSNPKASWAPALAANQIQPQLNLLATLNYDRKLRPILGTAVEVSLTLTNGEVLQGEFRSDVFSWKTGPLKGTGVKLESRFAELFKGGSFQFTETVWNWCKSRPRKFEFSSERQRWSFESNLNGWVLSSSSGVHKSFKPAVVEKWLGDVCNDAVTKVRDLATFPLPLSFSKADSVVIYGLGGQKERTAESESGS